MERAHARTCAHPLRAAPPAPIAAQRASSRPPRRAAALSPRRNPQPNLLITPEHTRALPPVGMPPPNQFAYHSMGNSGQALSRADGRFLKMPAAKFSQAKRFTEKAATIGPGPAAYAT